MKMTNIMNILESMDIIDNYFWTIKFENLSKIIY